MRGQAALFSSARAGDEDQDRWATPRDLFDPLHAEFGFSLDAAALANNRKVVDYLGPDHALIERRDGLVHPWCGVVWCNPPYSLAGDFAAVAQEEAHTHGLTCVLLVFARTDTGWWWRHVLGRDLVTRQRLDGVTCAAEIRWRPGRVAFLDPETGRPRLDRNGRPQSAPAPSVAIVYRGRCLADWPANGVL